MPSNFTKDDPILGTVDFDDYYVTDAWLVDQFVGNSLYAGGDGTSGSVGDGTTTSRTFPWLIGNMTNWDQVSCGRYHSTAVKNDGTLWVWGYNFYWTLGLSDRTHRSSPVQVGSLTNWKQVSGGHEITAAIKTDGTLWTWGSNYRFGALGLSDFTHRSSPTQVGTLTNWKQVAACWGIGGSQSCYAVKTDGTLWAWGRNGYTGNLGLGGFSHRSSPTQVGTLTNWKQVASKSFHCAAIKTDGTLWVWGRNSYGQLGLGDINHRSSPTQVGTLTNWKLVDCGAYHMLAVKTDGTVWSWGRNSFGQLGLGDITHRSSPAQVGALTNWKLVNSGLYQASWAIKTDGTLWRWGSPSYGAIGTGSSSSSPVQVGSGTNWKQVSLGDRNSLGVTFTDIG